MSNIKKIVLSFLMSFVILVATVQVSSAANVRISDEGVSNVVSNIKTIVQYLNSSTQQNNLSIGNASKGSSGYVSNYYQNGVMYGQINFYVDGQGYVKSVKLLSYSTDDKYVEVCGYILSCTVIGLGMTPDEAIKMGETLQSGKSNFSIYCASKRRYFDFNAYEQANNVNVDLSAHI